MLLLHLLLNYELCDSIKYDANKLENNSHRPPSIVRNKNKLYT